MASRNLITFITTILLVITTAFGGTLYAADSNCILYSIDTDTEIVIEIGDGNDYNCHELTYDCMTQTMYVGFGHGDDQLSVIDISNAAITLPKLDYTSQNSNPGLEFVDGTLYGWTKYAGFTIIDPATGDDTSNIISDIGIILGGLAYDICSNIMYGVTSGDTASSSGSWLVSFPLDTGAPTFIGSTNVTSISGLTFDDNGVLYGVSSSSTPGNLYTIDTETGAATFLLTIEDGTKFGAVSYVSDDGLCESCPTQEPTQIPTKAPTKITNNPTQSPTNDSDSPDCDCDCDCENGSSSSYEFDALLAKNKEDEAMDDMSENEGKVDRVVNLIIDDSHDTILFYCFIALVIVLFAIVFLYFCMIKSR